MLEIHLFVNPLGKNCRHCETDVVKCDQMTSVKVRCTIIPLLNMSTIQQTIKMYHLPENNLDVRSRICQVLYQAILDYKAAQCQGAKRARNFLLRQQKAIEQNGLNYDDKTAEKIAKEVSLDVDMFNEDRHGQLVKKAFKDDQELASRLGINTSETAVVVDTSGPTSGVKIDHFTFSRLLKFYQQVHCAKCSLMHLANNCADIKLFVKNNSI